MRLPLIPHPTSRHDGLTLEVEARRQGGRLSLDYALSGPVEAVLWPQQAARVRADDLWRATCFEAFAATPDGYVEYNLSPSGAWAAYRFDGYRRGMRAFDMASPFIVTRTAPGRLVLTADVTLPEGAAGKVGLTAVIQRMDGSIAYWALTHSSDKPDFHHPDSFALELP